MCGIPCEVQRIVARSEPVAGGLGSAAARSCPPACGASTMVSATVAAASASPILRRMSLPWAQLQSAGEDTRSWRAASAGPGDVPADRQRLHAVEAGDRAVPRLAVQLQAGHLPGE